MLIRTSLAETTQLLQDFKDRLDEVERKVDVLEVEVKELDVVNEKRKIEAVSRTKAEEDKEEDDDEAAEGEEDEMDEAFVPPPAGQGPIQSEEGKLDCGYRTLR